MSNATADNVTEIPTTSANAPRREWLFVLAIVVIGLGLRLPGFTESIWLDELYTSSLFCGDSITLLKTLYSDIHPPAYFLFIHLWGRVFGDSEVWLRTPPLLFGLGTIVLIWRLGRTFGGPHVGLAAALLLALSPVHIWFSQEGRPYAANVFLVVLTTLVFYRLMPQRRGFGWTLLFFCSLACLVFTHYYLAMFPFVFGALAWWRKSPSRWRIIVSSALVIAMLGVYMGAKTYFSDVPTTMTYLKHFDLREAWNLGFTWFLTGNSLSPIDARTELGDTLLLVIQILAVIAFVRGAYCLFVRQPHGGWPPGRDILLLLALIPLFLFALSFIDRIYIERSALPALPFFVLVIASGLAGWRKRRTRGVTLGIALLAQATILTGFFLHRDLWTVYKPNPDWRSAAALLGEEISRSAGVVPMYSDYVSPTGLTYYDARMREVKHFETNDRKVEKLLDTTSRVFGTDGFPGKQIQSAIRKRLDEYFAANEKAERDMRLAIHDLQRHDPLAADPIPREFWLLVHRDPGARARAVLADPRTQTVAEHAFRQLMLYKLRADG